MKDESVNVCGQSVHLLKRIIPILYAQQLSIPQNVQKLQRFYKVTRRAANSLCLSSSAVLFFTLVWDLIQMNRTQVQCQAVMFVRNRRGVCVCVWLASDAQLIMACPFLPLPPGCQDPWQNEATQML